MYVRVHLIIDNSLYRITDGRFSSAVFSSTFYDVRLVSRGAAAGAHLAGPSTPPWLHMFARMNEWLKLRVPLVFNV